MAINIFSLFIHGMEQGLGINTLYPPKKTKLSPVFTGKVSKPVLQKLSDAGLKTYSTAISAIGIAGMALSQKEEELSAQISKEQFIEMLVAKNVPEKELLSIVKPCVDKEGNISCETVQKVLTIIENTGNDFFDYIGINIEECFDNDGVLSQKALDDVVEYYQMDIFPPYIGRVIISRCKDGDNKFSTKALETAKELIKLDVCTNYIDDILSNSRDKKGFFVEEHFNELINLAKSLNKAHDITSFPRVTKEAITLNGEYSSARLRILDKLVQVGNTPLAIHSYSTYFKGDEEFFEVALDYVIKNGYGKKDLELFTEKYNEPKKDLILNLLKKSEIPISVLRPMVKELFNIKGIDGVLIDFKSMLEEYPDFPPELATSAVWRFYEDLGEKSFYKKTYKHPESAYNRVLNCLFFTQEQIERLVELRQKVLANPELYVNGEYDNEMLMKEACWRFFQCNYKNLKECVSVFDKETMDNLLRRRFIEAEDCADTLKLLGSSERELIKNLCKSDTKDGRQLSPSQKVELIDLVYAYVINNVPFNKMEEMISNNKVDWDELEADLFKNVMLKFGISQDDLAIVPVEKLQAWDLKHIHNLSKEFEENGTHYLEELIKISLFTDFDKHINDEKNDIGFTNARTRKLFEKRGLNYEKWVHPNKDLEVRFQTIDNNAQKLEFIAKQTEEDMATLMENVSLKSLLYRRFSKNIKDDIFVIPQEIYSSRHRLQDFLKNLNNQLQDVWTRAENNKGKNPKASATLAIKDHIEERLLALNNFKEDRANKAIDWTIKMWDRVPQKDLFQGNFSTCCIGMGRGYGEFMPHYLLYTAFNMIELVDNTTGKTVGNALCYFVMDKYDKPAFVLDNIEINNSVLPAKENGIKLRNSIVEYVSGLTKDISGQDDVPIYLSTNYNDVSCEDLKSKRIKMKFLGEFDSFMMYLDMYHDGDGCVMTKDDLTAHNLAYELKLH